MPGGFWPRAPLEELKQRTGTENLEETFVALLPEEKRGSGRRLTIPPRVQTDAEPAIVAKNLTRRFGKFTAVNAVNFTIERGEIFGFLGSNGCGKSTTMKMLTGLLPATEGEAILFGKPVDPKNNDARMRVGYMSQAFSLYGELTVAQNLWIHARLYHLPPESRRSRIDELVQRFGLAQYVDDLPESIPLGVRQRLSLAVAIIHDPEMLILDEPTSGVDPVARDEFWELLIELSREKQVTIFISTHFMNEAMRCDRISLMHAGVVLACDTPKALMAARGTDVLEEAFIGYIADASGEASQGGPDGGRAGPDRDARPFNPAGRAPGAAVPLQARPALAYSRRETLEILRDPVRLAFAFVGSLVLMLAFGFGITTDVENIRFAALDLDQTPGEPGLPRRVRGFARTFLPPATDSSSQRETEQRLRANDISLAIEMPTEFGRDFKRDASPEVSAVVDGANPFRAETIKQYVTSVNQLFVTRNPNDTPGARSLPAPRRDPVALPLQPELRERLRDRAEHPADPPDPDPGHPHGGERRAGEGARLDHQLLRDADHAARVPAGQAAPVHRDRDDQLRDPDAHGDRRLPGAAQGERPDADALRIALRDGDHGHRPPGLDLHAQPGRRGLRDGDPDHPADDPVLRDCSSRSRPWKGGRAWWARSGRRPTTCTRASGPSRRRSARVCSRATSWPWPSSSRC